MPYQTDVIGYTLVQNAYTLLLANVKSRAYTLHNRYITIVKSFQSILVALPTKLYCTGCTRWESIPEDQMERQDLYAKAQWHQFVKIVHELLSLPQPNDDGACHHVGNTIECN